MERHVEVVQVPARSYEKVTWIAKDGKVFDSDLACEKHEKELEMLSHHVFKTRICDVEIYGWDCSNGYLYHLRNAEDYSYLGQKLCFSIPWCTDWDEKGPGWYLFFYEDGGDYHDTQYLYHYETFLANAKQKLEDWETLLRKKQEEALEWEIK